MTDKEVLELCKEWFETIMERCDRLTSGNVSHNGRAIHGYAKNCTEFVAKHLEKKWKPSEEQMAALNNAILLNEDHYNSAVLSTLREQLKKLREE